jgi:hypothetical protein
MRFSQRLLLYAVFLAVLGGTRANCAAPPGFVEGHLNIVSLKEVELAHEKSRRVLPTKHSQNYAEYPLIILSKDGKREVARAIADREGNFRVTLPPGDYILDVAGRGHGPLRAEPQPFTIVSNQTVRIDMNIDTGIR